MIIVGDERLAEAECAAHRLACQGSGVVDLQRFDLR